MKKDETTIGEVFANLGEGESAVILSKKKDYYYLLIGDIDAFFEWIFDFETYKHLEIALTLWNDNKHSDLHESKGITIKRDSGISTGFMLSIKNEIWAITYAELEQLYLRIKKENK